jgi:hypothetical protein
MIKGIMGTTGVTVAGGNTSLPYVNQNHTNPMQGMLRIWGSDMQVYDGNNWMNLSTSYATVSLDQDVLDVIQWARTQRTMAMNRLNLAQNNPALMKVLERIKRAEDDFELLAKFVEHDHENTTA